MHQTLVDDTFNHNGYFAQKLQHLGFTFQHNGPLLLGGSGNAETPQHLTVDPDGKSDYEQMVTSTVVFTSDTLRSHTRFAGYENITPPLIKQTVGKTAVMIILLSGRIPAAGGGSNQIPVGIYNDNIHFGNNRNCLGNLLNKFLNRIQVVTQDYPLLQVHDDLRQYSTKYMQKQCHR